jgi:hypothetical protein
MNVGDLLNQVAYDAGETSGEYREAARRWLNLTRAEIADWGLWRSALKTDTFATAAATTSGIYPMTGYQALSLDTMYDETNNGPITHEAIKTLRDIDPDKSTTSSPYHWAEMGQDQAGEWNIYLWPIPDGAYTIRFQGYAHLDDLEDEDLEIDPFFGRLLPWSSTFAAGMRWYHDKNNNEEANQLLVSRNEFVRQVQRRATKNALAPATALRMRNIRSNAPFPGPGRLNPAHFDNG